MEQPSVEKHPHNSFFWPNSYGLLTPRNQPITSSSETRQNIEQYPKPPKILLTQAQTSVKKPRQQQNPSQNLAITASKRLKHPPQKMIEKLLLYPPITIYN
jgi:hypothetical protein